MDRITPEETVGAIVALHPELVRTFENAGMDYCCGGKRSLREACVERGIDMNAFRRELEAALGARAAGDMATDPASMSLSDLADHIENTHHAFLRRELPRLEQLVARVSVNHGPRDPHLHELRSEFLAMARELQLHMLKEERILFPIIRRIDRGEEGGFARDSIRAPIQAMEAEHGTAGSALQRMRELTGGYAAPDWACSSYRALLDGLTELERDLHLHIHKENNVLFPRALALETVSSP